MEKGKMLYEGKAKQVFETDNPDYLLVHYKDDATAFNGLKKGTIQNKGAMNNRISNRLMSLLEKHGIETHFVEELSDRETVVKRVEIVPVEVIVRNIAAGSLSKRVGLPEGTRLNSAVLEYSYKNDELGDPMINVSHVRALGLATKEEMDTIAEMAYKVNEILTDVMKKCNLILVDFKLEFGRYHDHIILADEISPGYLPLLGRDTAKAG